jgi:hypothetical protein
MATASYFSAIVISLFLTSFLIAGVYHFKDNTSQIEGYIKIPSSINQETSLNFNSSKDYCISLLPIIKVYDGNWSCSDIGLVSKPDITSAFYLPYSAQDNNGYYNHTYYVNDSANLPFFIIVRKGAFNGIAGIGNIFIAFENDKIRIPNNMFYSMSDVEYDWPGLFSTYDFYKIETVFDEKDDTLNLTVNGRVVFNSYPTNPDTILGLISFVDGYGGMWVPSGNIVLENVETKTNYDRKSTSSDTNILNSVTDIIGMVGLLIAYNIPGVEWWINLLFIKTQVVAAIIAGLSFIRGI